MCGIFGLVVRRDQLSMPQWKGAVEALFRASESRGKEAAGIAVDTGETVAIYKDSVGASQMLRSREYKRSIDGVAQRFYLNGADSSAHSPSNGAAGSTKQNGAHANGANGKAHGRDDVIAAIGHCRLVTNGLQGIDANNQPVRRDDAIVIHNGIVVNVDELWSKQNDIRPTADVDTEVIAALVEKYREGGASVTEAIRRTFSEIYGETSIAMLFGDLDVMALATNTGSLFVGRSKSDGRLFFASEAYICREFTQGEKALPGFLDADVFQVRAGEGIVVDLATLELTKFAITPEGPAAPAVSPTLATNKRIEDKAERYRELRETMRRCTRCVLPETMPFIEFDAEGVCNYCHGYQPIQKRDPREVEEHLNRYRRKDGSPDCIVAFSGGRDSSYGLHLLRTQFHMNPIAYTYDWGMVTDLARRNQSRMCAKLGIEHIWISADIKAKRANIQSNVRAWLKKPDLGIIPLFMAGDKQFFWYANKTMQQTGISLMVFCTNQLEKTDFKTGFLGIRPKDAQMRNQPTSMGAASKLNLFWQYGRRFIENPAYLNNSMADTLWAYWSYYVIKQDHCFLFDYLDWDEDIINDTLIGDYDWEKAKDTDSTWRIGDGTAPFYNYIYLTVAGFTEHDTFRSNQIREGKITRETAMRFVEAENVPRWPSIREYFQMINVDFDETVRIIDRIPKLYREENLKKIRERQTP